MKIFFTFAPSIQSIMLTYNLIAYLVYGLITYLITVRVGWLCYQNGYYFICEEIKDPEIAVSINKMLLVCYYLTNLGYVTLMIYYWAPVTSFQGLVESVTAKISGIVFGLGGLHFLNMAGVYMMRQKEILNH